MNTKHSRHLTISRLLTLIISVFLACVLALSLLYSTGSNQALAVTSAEKEAELDEAFARMDTLQTELNKIAADYDAAVAAHAEAEARMFDAATREEAARVRIAELQEQLGARAVKMYRDGQSSFLDVIFGVESFSDFTTALDMMNRVNDQDAKLVREAKETREAAEAARIEYTEQELITKTKQVEIENLLVEKENTVLALSEEIAGLEQEVVELRLQEELAAEAARQMALNLGVAALGEVTDAQLARIFAISPVYPFSSTQTISSGFGYRDFDASFHTGIDFAAPGGTPILAIGSGTVYQAGSGGAMGNYVMILHGDGIYSTYMHASALNCSAGQQVSAGDVIAYVGTTGNSTGNHLHLEITVDGPSFGGGTWVNPMLFY